MNIKTETWAGHKIRFVWHNDEWWAVANDIAQALDYRTTGDMTRIIKSNYKCEINPQTLGTTGLRTLCITNENVRRMTMISEPGIYAAIFRSNKPEAEQFQDWVYNMLKQLRQSTGLEGFQIFRMLDKEHQKEAMAHLKAALHNPVRVDFIKANTIANKAVSNKYGYPKMIKKGDMTPDMLVTRQCVLEDTVELMEVKEKYGLDISIANQIYKIYH